MCAGPSYVGKLLSELPACGSQEGPAGARQPLPLRHTVLALTF